MSDSETAVQIRLFAADGFVEDDWQRADSLDSIAGDGRIVLPLEAYLALDPERRESAAGRIGVELAAGEALEAIVPHLGALALIVLDFPAFTDGRSYSKAELLRVRYGYEGDIRAAGDVLIDQVSHLLRCGFTTLEISNPATLRRLEEKRLGGLPAFYQPTGIGKMKATRFSWRRVPA